MQTQPNSYNTHNEWATSLCDCCSDPQESRNQCCFFCSALWCQCAAQGTLQKHAGLSNDCYGPCCFYCCCSGICVPQCALFYLQRALLDAEKIQENCFCSLLKAFFCSSCTMNQLNNHFILKHKQFNAGNGDCCMHLMGCVKGAPLEDTISQTQNSMVNSMNPDTQPLLPNNFAAPNPLEPSSMLTPNMRRFDRVDSANSSRQSVATVFPLSYLPYRV